MIQKKSAAETFMVGQIFDIQLSRLSPAIRSEVEAWVVNTVKLAMVKKLDSFCEKEGKINARKLFLVPIFSISELKKRVEKNAPEIKTLFYQALMDAISTIEKRLIS